MDSIVATLTFLTEHKAMISVLPVIASLFMLKQAFQSKKRNWPPGPTGIPFLGYLPFLPAEFGDHLKHLFSKYGKIFSMRLGSSDVVFVSDFPTIKSIMVKERFQSRPIHAVGNTLNDNILFNWNGDKWKEQRKFSLQVLVSLGFVKEQIEESILHEIDDMLKLLAQNEKPVEITRVVGSCVSNVVTQMITGKRLEYTHPHRNLIDDVFRSRYHLSRPSVFGYAAYLPFVSQFLLSLPFFPGYEFKKKIDRVYYEFIASRIAELKKTFDPKTGHVTCFIEAYLKEMSDNPQGKYFDEKNLIGCAFAFFFAGTNTTARFVNWILLYMMLFPDIQQKVRQEIDEVIGSKRVSTKYRSTMPYTAAVIQEVHRIVAMVHSSLVHTVSEDSYLDKYLLPKGTHVVMSPLAVHSDPEYFAEPDKFMPERFISKEGKLVRDERVMPFGYGKRSCPGEGFAEIEVFLFTTAILQQFEIKTPIGKKYDTRSRMDLYEQIPLETPVEMQLQKR